MIMLQHVNAVTVSLCIVPEGPLLGDTVFLAPADPAGSCSAAVDASAPSGFDPAVNRPQGIT